MSKFYIRRELLKVKLEDCKDVTTYMLRNDRLVQDWNLCVDAEEADTAEDDGKVPAVRKGKKAMVIPDGEYISYLLYGIPNNDDWKIFLEFMEDKDAEDTMWPSEVITKMLEREKKLKKEKGLGHDTLLFAKNGKGRGKGKGKGKDNKGNGTSDDKKDKQSGSNETACDHCQNKVHIVRGYPSKKR
ncbi:hypothetical protein K440DRAFT_635719 [Wilcoxina mikolae CBS 423.85]|nr:hypothetical protein K440DRAFT_635719 [Wilcoxina mikolae CBS 423.85]